MLSPFVFCYNLSSLICEAASSRNTLKWPIIVWNWPIWPIWVRRSRNTWLIENHNEITVLLKPRTRIHNNVYFYVCMKYIQDFFIPEISFGYSSNYFLILFFHFLFIRKGGLFVLGRSEEFTFEIKNVIKEDLWFSWWKMVDPKINQQQRTEHEHSFLFNFHNVAEM